MDFYFIRGLESLSRLMGLCWLSVIIFHGLLVPMYADQICPNVGAEQLKETAFACFQSYNAQKQNLDHSGRKLYAGIDVETLRAYCSSYLQGLGCIGNLLNVCPERQHKTIKSALVNLQGVETELTELCRTNNLYEIYARVMNCYLSRGEKSEWCFESKLNNTVMNTLSSEEICSRMTGVTSCIENNIQQECGPQASDLVHLLVKPMVRGSSSCTYSVYQESTKGNQDVTQSSSNGGSHARNSRKQNATGSSGHMIASTSVILFNILFSLSTFTYYSCVS